MFLNISLKLRNIHAPTRAHVRYATSIIYPRLDIYFKIRKTSRIDRFKTLCFNIYYILISYMKVWSRMNKIRRIIAFRKVTIVRVCIFVFFYLPRQ